MKYFRRFLLFSVLMLLASLVETASAQNNIYAINDECYTLFSQGELSLGTPEGQTYVDKLRSKSAEVGDAKAQALCATLQLRQYISEDNLEAIKAAFTSALQITEQTGYLQYYFHAYTLLATYYFNKDQQISCLELVSHMQDDAIRLNSQYGRWNCYKFMGSLYMSMMKFNMARQSLQDAINLHRNTTENVVKAQPLTRLYTDLSETLEYGTPEMAECLKGAYESSKTGLDTLRADYYNALDMAVNRDYAGFTGLRDKCLANPHFLRIIKEGEQMFDLTDEAYSGDWAAVRSGLETVKGFTNNKYMASLLSTLGNKDLAMRAKDNMINVALDNSSQQYATVLSEVSARLDNDTLREQLLAKSASLNKVLRISFTVIFIMLIIFIAVMAMYMRQLRREKELADASNAAKTSFVQNMSHEIRTPLNAIVGFSQLLSLPDGMLTESEREQYSNYIKNSSSMLTMLIDDILDLSDVDNGNYQTNLAPCRPNDACRHAMGSVEYRVPAGVAFNFHSDVPDDFTIISDERRIEQVVINFLTNACKHTKKGEISVDCSLLDDGAKLKISVTDTGTGVPPEKAAEIFKRFAKLDRYVQGSGLGLNICCIIANNLNGRVYIDTDYGRCSGNSDFGSRFVFEIDLTKKPE